MKKLKTRVTVFKLPSKNTWWIIKITGRQKSASAVSGMLQAIKKV